jgi:hypothetical protein
MENKKMDSQGIEPWTTHKLYPRKDANAKRVLYH